MAHLISFAFFKQTKNAQRGQIKMLMCEKAFEAGAGAGAGAEAGTEW